MNCLTKRNSYMMLIHTDLDRALSSCIDQVLNSNSTSGTLVTLFSAPTELIFKKSDNNIIQKMVMDILPVVSSSDLEVRGETLGLVVSRSIGRVQEQRSCLSLKKEISKTHAGEHI